MPGWESPDKEWSNRLATSSRPNSYYSTQESWSSFAAVDKPVPNFREASHAVGLSPLRGNHYWNNNNLDDYKDNNTNFQYIKASSVVA